MFFCVKPSIIRMFEQKVKNKLKKVVKIFVGIKKKDFLCVQYIYILRKIKKYGF